jgi:hypothetical protein
MRDAIASASRYCREVDGWSAVIGGRCFSIATVLANAPDEWRVHSLFDRDGCHTGTMLLAGYDGRGIVFDIDATPLDQLFWFMCELPSLAFGECCYALDLHQKWKLAATEGSA